MKVLNATHLDRKSGKYRGRLAPSPTGYLHLGHARTFWIAQQRAIAAGGALVLRDEDLDPARSQPQFRHAMMEDLRWLGLSWQEGPDVGGPFAPLHPEPAAPSLPRSLAPVTGRRLALSLPLLAQGPCAGHPGPARRRRNLSRNLPPHHRPGKRRSPRKLALSRSRRRDRRIRGFALRPPALRGRAGFWRLPGMAPRRSALVSASRSGGRCRDADHRGSPRRRPAQVDGAADSAGARAGCSVARLVSLRVVAG